MSTARALPPLIIDELDRNGLPWRLEDGHGHRKLIVAERLAGVVGVTLQDTNRRPTLNLRANIRRIARELSAQSGAVATVHQIADYLEPMPAAEPVVEPVVEPTIVAAPEPAPRKPRVHRPLAEVRAQVVEAIEAGFTQYETAALIGISQSQVNRTLKGLHRPYTDFRTRIPEADLRRLAVQGKTLTQMAAELGASAPGVRHALNRLGIEWTRDTRGRKPAARPAPRPVGLPNTEILRRLRDNGIQHEDIASVYGVTVEAVDAAMAALKPACVIGELACFPLARPSLTEVLATYARITRQQRRHAERQAAKKLRPGPNPPRDPMMGRISEMTPVERAQVDAVYAREIEATADDDYVIRRREIIGRVDPQIADQIWQQFHAGAMDESRRLMPEGDALMGRILPDREEGTTVRNLTPELRLSESRP